MVAVEKTVIGPIVRITNPLEKDLLATFVQRVTSDVDLARAAAHIQLMAEHWFGPQTVVPCAGVVDALVELYGYAPAPAPSNHPDLDLQSNRISFEGMAHEIMGDLDLYREGLRVVLERHV